MKKTKEAPQVLRLDLEKAKFIESKKHLLNDNMKKPFNEFYVMLNKNEKLTPNQHSFLDGMYECVMGKITGQRVNIHVDLKANKKKNLRY